MKLQMIYNNKWVHGFSVSKVSLCFCFLFLTTNSLYAQRAKIDSLQLVIDSSIGRAKIEPLISLVRLYGATDNRKALGYAKEVNKLAYEFGDSINIVVSSRLIGQLYNRLSMIKEAQGILLRTIFIAKRNKLMSEYKVTLSNLAITYAYQAKYDKALEMNFEALALRDADKEYDEIAFLLNNIGLVYFKLNNKEKALEFYIRALDLKKSINDTYDLDRLLINTGLCYNQLKNFSKSSEYFKKAFEECGKNCSDQIIIEGEFGLGIHFYKRNEFLQAQKHLLKSLILAKKIGDHRFEAENLNALAAIYLEEKKYDSALAILSAAEKISIESGYNDILIDTYSELSKLHSHFKDFKKTAYYQGKYINLRDSIYSEELTQNLMAVQAEYEQRENKAKIESQNNLLVLKEEIIGKQQWLNILAVATVLLLVAFVITLFRNNQQKKKTNQLLELKVQERTKELSQSYQLIEKAYADQTHLIVKASSDIKSPLSTMKGLCSLALQEIEDPSAKQYMIQMDATTTHLSEMVNKLSVRA